jgi:hypothetical protein
MVAYQLVQGDQTTEISCYTTGTLFQYLIEEWMYEFWDFFNLQDGTADGVSSCLLKELSNVGTDNKPSKVVVSAYDGTPVMNGLSGGVPSKINERDPAAKYFQCHAHKGN